MCDSSVCVCVFVYEISTIKKIIIENPPIPKFPLFGPFRGDTSSFYPGMLSPLPVVVLAEHVGTAEIENAHNPTMHQNVLNNNESKCFKHNCHFLKACVSTTPATPLYDAV